MKRLGLWGCLGVAVVAATGALGAGNDEDELLADILPVYARTGGVYTILIDRDEFYPPTFGYQLTPHTNRVASLECTWPGTFNAYLRTGHQGENPTIIVSQGIERSNDQYDYYLPEALKAAVAAKPEYDWNDIDEGTIVGVSACKAAVELQHNDNHMLRLSLRDKEIAQEAVVELSERIDALEREIRALKAVHAPNGGPKLKVVPPPQTNQSKAKPFDALPFGVDIATLPVMGGAMERYGEIEAEEKSDRLGFGFTTIKVHADRKTGTVFGFSAVKKAELPEYKRICQEIEKAYGIVGREETGSRQGEMRFALPHRTIRICHCYTLLSLERTVSLAVEDRDAVDELRCKMLERFEKDRLDKFDFGSLDSGANKMNVLRRRKYKEFPSRTRMRASSCAGLRAGRCFS